MSEQRARLVAHRDLDQQSLMTANWPTTDAASGAVDEIELPPHLLNTRNWFVTKAVRFESDAMPRFRASQQPPTNGAPSDRVSDHPERLSAGTYDAISDEFLQSQELQPAGSTSAEIASELNNLLAVIIGNAELLKEVPDNANTIQHLSDYIIKAAERGTNLSQRLQSLDKD